MSAAYQTGAVPYSCSSTAEGNIQFPDGTILTPGGYMKYPDGAIHVADARGSYRLPDGSTLLPDMSISFADGSRIHPNGLIQSPGDPMGTVIATPAPMPTFMPSLPGSVSRVQTFITPQVAPLPAPILPTIPGGSVVRETYVSSPAFVSPNASAGYSAFNIMDLPPGTIQLAGGAYRIPNGCVLYPEGTVKLPDGSIMQVDGTVVGPSGQPLRPQPDGSYKLRDGTFLLPDGTIRLTNNRIKLPDGSIQVPGAYPGPMSMMSTPLPAITSTVTRSAPLALLPPPSSTYEQTAPSTVNLPNGMIQYADGTLFLPSTGVTRLPDGTVKLPDGTTSTPAADGSHRLPNGSILKSDNSIMFADGATLKMDGSVQLPDGAVINQEGGLQQAPKHTNNVFAQPPSAMYPAKIVVDPELLKISQMQPDGSVRLPNGMTLLTDGRVRLADGNVKYIDGRLQNPKGQFKEGQPDGSYRLEDGSVLRMDGGIQYPDRSIKCMDNTLVKPDGTIVLPDGSCREAGFSLPNYDVPAFQYPPRIPVGSIQLPDGSYKIPSGAIQYFDGAMKLLNGYYRLPDGRVVRPDGATATYLPDGAVKVSEDADFLPDLNTRFRDGAIKQPDGCVRLPPPNHNSVQLPTGVVKPAPFALPTFPMPVPFGRTDDDVRATLPRDSTRLYPGCYKLPSGVLRVPDGSFVLPSYSVFQKGTIALPNGGVWFPDGSTILPNGQRTAAPIAPGGDNNSFGLFIKMVDDRVKNLSRVAVHAVDPNSSAYRAGVQPNDFLTTWNNNEIVSADEFMAKLRAARPGETVNLGIERPPTGEQKVIPVAVESKNERAIAGSFSGGPTACTLGCQVEMLDDPATGAKQSIASVVRTEPGGPADRARITMYDRLMRWNNDPLNSMATLQNKLNTSRPGEKVSLAVQRGGQLFGAEVILAAAQPGMRSIPPPPIAGAGQTPTLGLMIKMIDDKQGRKESAVCVHECTAGGPAEKAGLRSGDVIVSWNEDPLNEPGMGKFSSKLQNARIGETVVLKIDRMGQMYQTNVVIGPKPMQAAVGGDATLGLSVRMIEDKFGNRDRQVLVDSVLPSGPAQSAGIIKDDILVAWNGDALNSYPVFENRVKTSRPGDVVSLQVDRRGQLLTFPVKLEARQGGAPGGPVSFGMGVRDNFGRVTVHEVSPDGPAARANIQVNDVITHWDNVPLTMPVFAQKYQNVRSGDMVNFTIERGGRPYSVQLNTAGARGPEPKPFQPTIAPVAQAQPTITTMSTGQPWIGFAVKKAPGKDSIFVKDVAEGGPAAAAGIVDGDEVTNFGGDRTYDMNSFRAAVKRNAQVGRTIPVTFMRDANGVDNALTKTVNLTVAAKQKEVVDCPRSANIDDIRAILDDPRKLDLFARAAFAEADEDLSGFITAQEFATAMKAWLTPSVAGWMTIGDLQDMFEQADVDRSGMLVKSEFPTVIEDLLTAIVKHLDRR